MTGGKRFDFRVGSVASGTLDIFDFASSTSRLTITQEGWVGINTPFPSSTFHVAANRATFASSGQCTDYAEYYPASEPVEPGDIVASDAVVSSTKALVKKATASSTESILGIVSTNPAVIVEGNSVQFMNGANYKSDPLRPALALAGRVPVKISAENGNIRIGAPLTLSSSSPGVAMRQTEPGMSIGVALEEYPLLTTNYSLPTSTSTPAILIFVNRGFSLGAPPDTSMLVSEPILSHFARVIKDALASLGMAFQNGVATIKEVIADKITAKNITGENMNTEKLCVGSTCVDEATLKQLLQNQNVAPSAPAPSVDSALQQSSGQASSQPSSSETTAGTPSASEPSPAPASDTPESTLQQSSGQASTPTADTAEPSAETPPTEPALEEPALPASEQDTSVESAPSPAEPAPVSEPAPASDSAPVPAGQ